MRPVLDRFFDRFIIFSAIITLAVMLYSIAALAQASQPVATEGMATWLSSHPAISSLIFVLLSFVATRALDLGLREKIPKKWLPIVSAILGCAGQVSVALVAGAGWEQAIMFGVVSGLGGAGMYSAGGKYIPGMTASSEK